MSGFLQRAVMPALIPPDDRGIPATSAHVVSLLEGCEGVLQDLRHAASRGAPPAPLLAQVEAHWAARHEALTSEVRTFLTTAGDEEITRFMAHGSARVRRAAVAERGRRIASRR